MIEKNDEEKAGDQAENESDFARATRGEVERPACPLVERGEAHDRHPFGPIDATVHCPGFRPDQDDGLETYAAAMRAWEAENPWSSKYGPLVHHARKLAQKLDTDPGAPASLSSAYLQAITRLERFRPGAVQPAGDGLTPAGQQPSIFDAMED